VNKNDSTSSARLDAIQARFALRLAAGLSEHAETLSPDITAQAQKAPAEAHTIHVNERGAATLSSGPSPDDGAPWWTKIAIVLPLLALIAGLLLIQHWHQRNQIAAAAEMDLTLLTDDLPPDAFGDPGFLEFLKTPRD
jgi:hypothetical protein